MSVLGRRGGAVALGLTIDRLVGEPPARFHPVAHFGTGMDRLERRVWADEKARGAAFVAGGVGVAATVGRAVERLLGDAAATSASVAVSSAGLALTQAALAVGDRLRSGDLDGARAALPALVGRDPSGLDEKEIARAVVESVAENLSDAVVATALWGLLGGAPFALAHRGANTLDAMVGHRSPRHTRFGWAAARLDDLMGWPAARATAVLVAAAVPGRAAAVWRACRRDAPRHPSPNAGVAEAAFAAALDLRLGGVNRYGGRVEVRPPLGEGAVPSAADIDRAVDLTRRTITLLQLALLAGWAIGLFGGRRPVGARGKR